MRIRQLRNPYFQLVLAFLGLVLLPSLLLGYFSLRAVESEKVASRLRLLEDYERYADLSRRAVHQELEVLENAWGALVSRGVDWEQQIDTMIDVLQSVRGQAYIRDVYLLHAAGVTLFPFPGEGRSSRASLAELPSDSEARSFNEWMALGEKAEFEDGDYDAARTAYQAILEGVRLSRLRAIALTRLGSLELHQENWSNASRHYEEVIRSYPETYDLDNQPLRLNAKLQMARAQEGIGDPVPALGNLLDLYEDLLQSSGELGRLQFEVFRERVEGRIERLLAENGGTSLLESQQRFSALRSRDKKPVADRFFINKLSRKLVRARLEGLAYSTPLRYLSDVEEQRPYLLVYMFLPDSAGRSVTGLIGFQVDLKTLSAALLPGLLAQLQLSGEVGLGIVDEADHMVIGGGMALDPEARVAASNLGEPFGFWNVAVFSRDPGRAQQAIDFRTKVLLYVVLLLLVTILGGALLIFVKLQHEARLSRQKTNFVSSVSHELRTPLTSIRMFAELLEESGDSLSPSDRQRYLVTIRRECERLQRLIESVLDFARHERGVKNYSFEFEEIEPLVRSVVEGFRGQAEAEGFTLTVEIAEGLPEIRIDADATRQVLLNLLSNALNYSDEERSITIRVFQAGGEIALQVQDSGIGIDEEHLERIFDDFYRVDRSNSVKLGGVGLGLTLVRRIVQAHAGRVTVESQPGRGSTFTVWLPVTTSEVAMRAGGQLLTGA